MEFGVVCHMVVMVLSRLPPLSGTDVGRAVVLVPVVRLQLGEGHALGLRHLPKPRV